MPELPDVTLYIEALEKRIQGQPLLHARLASPFLLRTVEPPIGAALDKRVRRLRRLGKRIATFTDPSFTTFGGSFLFDALTGNWYDLPAQNVTLAGEIRGNVHCDGRLEILPGGAAHGDVDTGALVVHEGAFIESRFQMRSEPAPVR